ncbi:uncharacterized protein BO87DRAFT_377481 [Aspergillus neoniger CBS 115656]|uniref:Uncharacterized protein n=1 Tax=Aspergillus neoniger (strain CBS 115656) TaxID=1448310 RepID=A0A318ZA04_ASPNB|nr:hypothetical protein BO87DRAFT_377481 [Aspergillus neoniger CBS 115656]PYH33322.1 hypothetical protein BO87DRAFT_377481 [Aspergillus neoniger CBS 115656]
MSEDMNRTEFVNNQQSKRQLQKEENKLSSKSKEKRGEREGARERERKAPRIESSLVRGNGTRSPPTEASKQGICQSFTFEIQPIAREW